MGNYKNIEIGAVTPLEILKQSEPNLVRLYAYLLTQAKNSGGSVQTTAQEIADHINVNRKTVFNHKNKLVKLGLIHVAAHKHYCTWSVIVSDKTKFFALVTEDEQGVQNLMLEECNKLSEKVPELHFSIQGVQGLDIASSTGTESSSGIKTRDTSSGNKPVVNDEIDELNTEVKRTKFMRGKRDVTPKTRFSQELKPVPPVLVSDVVKFGNKFPYTDDKGWFESFIWLWAVRRYELHNIDVMLGQLDLYKMKVKLKILFDKIVKNDFKNAENYIEWYLNCKDKFIKETVAYGFEYMVSISAINKFLLNKRAEKNPKRPLFYDDTNRHEIRGKVF